MERRKPLKRNKELRADADKVREFLNRSRQPLKRTPMRSRGRDRPPEGPLTPAQWREAVFKASDGRCIISDARARNADDRRFHAHHPLAKRILRDRSLYGWVWDARNGLWLRRDVHASYELRATPISAERLPASVWEFCAELDALEGTEWATQLVLRAHPYTNSQEGSDGEGTG